MIHKIRAITDERIAPYLSLKEQKHLFIAEGQKVVQKLFDSSHHVESVLCYEKYLDMIPEGIKTFVAPPAIMTQIVGYKMHQGIMALAAIPPPLELDDMVGSCLVLNALANAENVGAILRNCAAFGIRNIIYDAKCSPPYLRRSVKTCMGAIFDMNLFLSKSLCDDLTLLKKRGYFVVGADPHVSNPSLYDLQVDQEFAIVIGSEGKGIDLEVKEKCHLIRIPIADTIDSLNAAAASSIFCYQLSRPLQ